MGFKCVPQVKGLVCADGMRRDGKGQSKHRANAAVIINEAFLIADPNDGHPIPYRKSASETYERTLTKDNKYTGYSTADDVMAAIEREAAAQTVDVQVKDKKTGETVIRQRPLRSDAVIGVAVIFNPPGAVACHWTPDQNAKFLQDSLDVMEQIQCSVRVDKTGKQKNDPKRSQQECHLFRRENIIATAEHRDEGEPEESEGVRTPNWHVVYKPEGEDGKYKGNLIDVYFLSHLCKEYPRMMRDRGWDIDDCDLTDFSRFSDKSDPESEEYRLKRKAKIREGGKSVNKHRARANRKKEQAKLEEAQEILDRASGTKRDADDYAERTRTDAEAEAGRIVDDAEREKAGIEADAAALSEERDRAVLERDAAKQAYERIGQEAGPAQIRLDAMKKEIESLRGEIDGLRKAKERADREYGPDIQAAEAAKAERDSARKETEKAKRDRDAVLEEIRTANEDAEAAKRNRDAFRGEADAARREVNTVKKERDDAVADRDAARREADELRRTMVERAKQEAQKIKDQIDEEYRRKWKAWVDGKKKEIDRKAAEIIENAKAKAADIIAAATGEHAFLREWFGSPAMTFSKGPHQGKTQLQVAQEAYKARLRQERVLQIPQAVRDAGKGHQPEAERTLPGE